MHSYCLIEMAGFARDFENRETRLEDAGFTVTPYVEADENQLIKAQKKN
jgi:hypothetical protein